MLPRAPPFRARPRRRLSDWRIGPRADLCCMEATASRLNSFLTRHLGYGTSAVLQIVGLYVAAEALLAGGIPPLGTLLVGAFVLGGCWVIGIRWAVRMRAQMAASVEASARALKQLEPRTAAQTA